MGPIILVALLVAACAGTPEGGDPAATATVVDAYPPAYPGPGDYVRGLVSGGTMRWFKVHIPDSYRADRPLPLVIGYHGAGGSFAQQELLSGMSALADVEDFVAVYPQGSGWEAVWKIDEPVELVFTRDLLDHLERSLSVDRARIYATGFSNGGGLADRLACDLAERIAAVAPVAGAYLYWAPCEPVRPVPILFFHGTDDLQAPYVEQIRGRTYTVPGWAQAWAQRNGCQPEPVFDFQEGSTYGQSWGGCDQGADVKLFAVEGAGHLWPGSRYGLAQQYVDASAIIWDFFAAHSLPAASVQALPNPAPPGPEPLHARVDVGRYWLYLTCQGREHAAAGPTVILESAAGVEVEQGLWETVPGRLAEFAQVCQYDRAGLGWSDPSPLEPRTARTVAAELHALLEKGGIEGPVILVGHSLGGVFARAYATDNAGEVAGLVLLDTPHEDSLDTLADLLAAQAYAYAPGGEFDPEVDLALTRAELLASRQAGAAPLGDLPLVVISRGRQAPDPDRSAEELQADLAHWQELQADLASLSTAGRLVIAGESGHFVHFYEPELVVDAVRQIMESATP